jgi:hypothetical protein
VLNAIFVATVSKNNDQLVASTSTVSGFFENGSNLHILVLNLCRNAVENSFPRVVHTENRWLDVLNNSVLITRHAAVIAFYSTRS